MFQDELRRVKPIPRSQPSLPSITQTANHALEKHIPIVENLAPQNVPPDPPAILIPLLNQPIMPQHLRVKIENLKRRMMHMGFRPLEEEEAVVVDELGAAVQMHKRHHVDVVGPVEQIRGFEVEVTGPEVEGLGVVGDAHAEVAEFVDFGGACGEEE